MKPCLLSISVAAIMASFNGWADLEHAQANGLIAANDFEYPIIQSIESGKTRAEVLEELEQARKDGVLDFADNEYPDSRAGC